MMKGFFVLLGCLVVVTTGIGNAQVTQFDISTCFNGLLQQKTDYSSDTRLALATLSQIDESNYEIYKHDANGCFVSICARRRAASICVFAFLFA